MRPEGTPTTSLTFHKHGGDIMDKDLDQAKGRIKQAVGDLTDDKDLKKQGKADEQAGKVKEVLDDTKVKADHLVDRVKDRVTKP